MLFTLALQIVNKSLVVSILLCGTTTTLSQYFNRLYVHGLMLLPNSLLSLTMQRCLVCCVLNQSTGFYSSILVNGLNASTLVFCSVPSKLAVIWLFQICDNKLADWTSLKLCTTMISLNALRELSNCLANLTKYL